MAAKDTVNQTWLIESAEEFKAFRDEVNNGTAFGDWTVSLGADIDLAGEENFGTIGIDEDLSFRGTFDGANFTISNLKITSTENNVGLFGYIAGATIRNFTLENADVTGEKCTAAVVGNANSGTIENVTVQGVVNVSGTDSVGAVAGQGYAILKNITVNVDQKASAVKGTLGYIGGVMGNCFEGEKTLENISSNISVIGESFDIVAVGGIFGYVGGGFNTIDTVECTALYVAGYEIEEQDIPKIQGLFGEQAADGLEITNAEPYTGEIRYSYYAGNDPETPLIYHGAYQVRNNRKVTLYNAVFCVSNVIVGTARGMGYGGDSSAAAEGETGKLTLGAGSEITTENVWVGGDQTGEGKASAGADRNFHLIVDGGKLTSTDEVINVRFDGDMEVKNGGTVDTNCLNVKTSLDVTGEGTNVTVENALTLEGGETEETAAVMNISDGAVVNVPGWAQESWPGNLNIGNDTEYAAVNVSGAVLQAKNVNINAKGKVTLNNGTLEATAAVNNGEFYAAGSKIEADSISGSGTFTIGSGNSELQIGNLQQDIRVNENTDKAVALTGNVGTENKIRVYGEAVLNDFSVNGDYEGKTVSATGQVLVYGDTVISGDSKMALNYFQSTASVTIESGVSIRTANINIYDMEPDSDFVFAGSMEAATLIIVNNYYNVASGSEMIVAEGGVLNGVTQNGNGRFDIQAGCMTVYGYVNSTWGAGGGEAYIGNSGYDAILTVDGTYASDDSNNGKFINNGTQNLIIGVAGWLKLVNGAEFTWTADITNNNWITMDAASTLTAGTLTGNGVITIDAEGFTGTKAVIDLNGNTSLEGRVEFENLSDDIRVIYGNDGDVILTDADTTTLYANTGWAGTKAGTDLGNGRIYGGNAFDSFVQALDEKTANTTSFVVYSDFSEALAGKTLTGNIINGGENAVTIADSANDYVNMTGFTLGENITIDAAYFYLYGNNEINGHVSSGTTFYSSGKLTLNGTAEVYTVMSRYYASLEDGIYIVGTAEAGKGAEADVQLKAVNYLGHYSGTFSVKDTAVEFGYILLNGSNDGDIQAQLVLDNAKVSTIGGPNTQPGQVLMNDDAAIIATNKSVLDFRGPKEFGYILMEENNSISLNDSTLLLGKEGQGSNTLNGEVTLENNALLSTIGSITNAGTLSASGSTVNIGSGVTNSDTIVVTDSTFTADGAVSNTGTFTVSGESTLTMTDFSGNAVQAAAGTILENSSVGGTVEALGDLAFEGNANVKKLKSSAGGKISVEEGKTLTLGNFAFGNNNNANAEYVITGGKITADYGFFQYGKYTLESDFETGYMYYSYGSDITVKGTFHSQGAGDGLDYVRGKLVIAEGGKSIHDKALWIGDDPAWNNPATGYMTVENGGNVTAGSITVQNQSSLTINGTVTANTVNNSADIVFNEKGVLTAATFNGANGTITIDVTDGWTGAHVLIDAADGTSAAQFGNIVIDADDAAAGVKYSIDETNGNLVIHNVNTETVYFNTEWTGKALGEKVGDGIHYGYNAFDEFTDNGVNDKGWSNLMVLPADTTEIVLTAGNGDDASYGMLRPTQSITVKTEGEGYAVIDRFVNMGSDLIFAAGSKVKVLCVIGLSGANNQGGAVTINGEVYLANADSSNKALYLWGMSETPGKLVINAGGILKADCGNVENHGTISVYGKMELGKFGDAPKLAGVGAGNNGGWHGHLNVDGKDGEGILTVNHNRINFGGGNTSHAWEEPAGDTACTVTISNGGKITTEAVYFRNGAKSIMTIDNGTLEFVTSGSYNYSWNMADENLRYFDNLGKINVSGNGKVDMSGRNFTNAGTFTLTDAEMTVDELTNSGTFTLAGETTLNTTGAVGAVSLQKDLVLDGNMVLDTVKVDGAAEVVGKMSAANVDVFDNDLTVSGEVEAEKIIVTQSKLAVSGGSVSGDEISLKSIVTLTGLQPVDENRTLAISFVPVDQHDEGTTLDIDIPAGSKEVRAAVAASRWNTISYTV